MPGAVALAGDLEWQMLTILPGPGRLRWRAAVRREHLVPRRPRRAVARQPAGLAAGRVRLARRGADRGAALLRRRRPCCWRRCGPGARPWPSWWRWSARRWWSSLPGGRGRHALEHRPAVRGRPAQRPGHAGAAGGDGGLQRAARGGDHVHRADLLRSRPARTTSGTPSAITRGVALLVGLASPGVHPALGGS